MANTERRHPPNKKNVSLAGRDEADIILCTALIGKRLKKACTAHGSSAVIDTNHQSV
jgi:hypothetical protein